MLAYRWAVGKPLVKGSRPFNGQRVDDQRLCYAKWKPRSVAPGGICCFNHRSVFGYSNCSNYLPTREKTMRSMRILTAVIVFTALTRPAWSQVPQSISYQGRVTVGGTNFDGTGQFKFELVDGTGATTFWSNDGTNLGGGEPEEAVSLTVTKGLYSVLLGDTTLPNMT